MQWPASPEFLAAIAGAITGAVAGGGISATLQLRALRRAAADRAADQRERYRTRAFALLVKMSKVVGGCERLAKHVELALASPEAPGLDLWQAVRPLANIPDPVCFTTDEMTVLASAEGDLIRELMRAEEVHNSARDVALQYRDVHRQITAGLRNVRIGNRAIEFDLAQALREMAPQIATANDLVKVLQRHCREDATRGARLHERLTTLFHDQLGLPVWRPNLPDGSGDML